MQLYNKLSPLGKQVVLDAAAACGVAGARIAKALTPPGDSCVCIKFAKVRSGGAGWDELGRLDKAGFYTDILSSGYHSECDTAFVGAQIFVKYQADQAAKSAALAKAG